MKKFFEQIRESIYSPRLYAELLECPIGASFGYYFKFFGLLILLGTIFASIVFLPKLITFVDRTGGEIAALYPEELVVTFKNGEVSVNMEEPVLIPFTPTFQKVLKGGQGSTATELQAMLATTTPYLIAIDTRGIDPGEAGYVALITFTKYTIIYPSEGGGFTVDPLPSDLNGIVTKGVVNSVLTSIGRTANFLPVGFVLFALLAGVVYLLFHLAYLIIAALPIMLIFASKGLPVSYARAYQVGLHALTAPILLKLLLFPFIPNIPFLFTLLVLAFAWGNLSVINTAKQ